mmetsp:Transcript_24714/g.75347  ORF Transcript_24714/g.75347 Transcript_24714/m.75347 type:complete len:204 (+) Transcript_24714:671-1282(+)|eukprot:scaffold33992_cov31-Tisochrysis_lutea.AAC.2
MVHTATSQASKPTEWREPWQASTFTGLARRRFRPTPAVNAFETIGDKRRERRSATSSTRETNGNITIAFPDLRTSIRASKSSATSDFPPDVGLENTKEWPSPTPGRAKHDACQSCRRDMRNSDRQIMATSAGKRRRAQTASTDKLTSMEETSEHAVTLRPHIFSAKHGMGTRTEDLRQTSLRCAIAGADGAIASGGIAGRGSL